MLALATVQPGWVAAVDCDAEHRLGFALRDRYEARVDGDGGAAGDVAAAAPAAEGNTG